MDYLVSKKVEKNGNKPTIQSGFQPRKTLVINIS